jgi:nucleolar protein 12
LQDRGCVDEVLALDQSKLKFAKRKLRVQRCKTLPGSSTSARHVTAAGGKIKTLSQGPVSVPVPIVIPKGDPSLGKKLAHLPKEARKQYKSSDADRVARRLAKKKARIALGNKGVKPLGKERERVRKDKGVGAEKGKGAVTKKESKGRVRSEKSLSKRNMKK